MRDQKHDAVFCERLQIDERLLFRVSLSSAENRIVQNENRLIVAQCAGKRKALLPDRRKGTRRRRPSAYFFAVGHFRDLLASCTQRLNTYRCFCCRLEQNVVFHAVVKELRVVPKVADDARAHDSLHVFAASCAVHRDVAFRTDIRTKTPCRASDLPHATAPVMPMIWPFFAENEISSRIFSAVRVCKAQVFDLERLNGRFLYFDFIGLVFLFLR